MWRHFGIAAALLLTAGAPDARSVQETTERREQFRAMFARAYVPGRSGHLLVVPRERHILTRADPSVAFMHGSPWPYDVTIPLFFFGPHVTPGTYAADATQQDVAPTIAAALGTSMPASATGRPLPILAAGAPRPRAVALFVLDGMRLDYLTTHANAMPTLTRLRTQGAWMTNTRVNYLPTNTAVGHSTILTGSDPRVHGITGNNVYDRVRKQRRDFMAGVTPGELLPLTLADMWQLEQRGRPVVIAMGTSVPATTALAGHGSCQLNGVPTTVAAYDERTGNWTTNPACYAPIDAVKDLSSASVYPPDGMWMGFKVDTPAEIRRTALWPRFEADTLTRLIEASDFGRDDVADLVLLNLKAADYVGHRYGPESAQVRAALAEIDLSVTRIIAAITARAGDNVLLAFTADHGMPAEPPAGGRHFAPDIVNLLHSRFDPEQKTLIAYYEPENAQIFVDLDRMAALKLTLRDLARFLETQPYIFAAFTQDEVRWTPQR